MSKSKKRRAAQGEARPPKIYSIETPYGFLTFLEGHGDNGGEPFLPGTLEAWQKDMREGNDTQGRAK